VQQNWQAYSIVAGAGFTVGVPIFRWIYGRYKQKAAAAIAAKQSATERAEYEVEALRQRLDDAEKAAAAALEEKRLELEGYRSTVQPILDQKSEWEKSVKRIQDERNYIQGQYDALIEKYNALKPKPVP